MATVDHPEWLKPQSVEWVSKKRAIQSRSPTTGSVEAIEFPAERWQVSQTYPARLMRDGGPVEAFFARVVGGVERIRLFNRVRPVPRGTMRGAPTLNAPIVRGARQIAINTTGTLEAGDFFKVGNQLHQAFQSAQPSGGVLIVDTVHRVREAASAGAAVLWDRPTALFIIPADSNRAGYSPGTMDSFTHEFDEVYQ